ncbi:hypothetical protein N0B31_19610 [Salinirubellus salinus]|uniref:Uncharacterized protein n=1 Tax=Salinirubellus salinus TaxID=1364945 RepID=A0A9E7R2D2_9EURY|nr:hypothetical protein [Salinirubellus salinus]UWM54311.1 hypothetical protein N0B31_19610 [Salinirubellus salinus]
MSGGDLSRRRVLLASAAAATGLAGCTGGGAPSGGGTSSPTATPTATATSTPTATDSPTPTESATASPGPADSFCAPLDGSPTPFDVAGTPYVFAFDYVDSWSVGEPIEQSNGRYERLESPVLRSENGESSATIRVGQSFDALTAAEAESFVQDQIDREDSTGVAYEESFGGETVRFVEFPNVDVNSYVFVLPYGDGEARYYPTSIVTFLDGGGPGQTVSRCPDAVDAATQTVRASLTVNAESTT